MASISGEYSVVHYFDAEKNELMFVRFWVNGHEVLMPLSELVHGLEDGKDIEPLIPADTGSQAAIAGTGKNIGLVLGTHTNKNLSGETVYTFPANRFSYTRTTEATRKSEGLGDGDWYLPDVVDSFKVFSKMKVDGTDSINDSLSAISSRRSLSVSRWCCSRYANYSSWFMYGRGSFGSGGFSASSRCCAVALLEY